MVAGEALHMRAKVVVVIVSQVAGVADKGFLVGSAFATRVTCMQTFQVLFFCLFDHSLLKRLCSAVQIGPYIAQLSNRAKRRTLKLV